MNYDGIIKIANKNVDKCSHPEHRLIAVIIKGGNVISTGWNYSHIHAEHTAINRAWRSNIKGTTMVVLRLKKSGGLGMAKPCKKCEQKIVAAGIKNVVYTDVNGNFVSMRP